MKENDSLEINSYIKSYTSNDSLIFKHNNIIVIVSFDDPKSNPVIEKINCDHKKSISNKDKISIDSNNCLSKHNPNLNCSKIKNNKLDLSCLNKDNIYILTYVIKNIFQEFNNFTELDLSNLCIGTDLDLISAIIEIFFYLENLEVLALSNNKLNDDSVTHIFCDLQQLSKLKMLNLKNNEISDESLNNDTNGLLGVLTNNSNVIETINLQNNKISTEGAKYFISNVDIPTLKYINFQWNKIKDDDKSLVYEVKARRKEFKVDF